MSRGSVSNPRRKNRTRSRFGTVSSKCQATNQLSLMWIINSAQGHVYTVFKNPTTKGITMKTKNLVEKVAVVPGQSNGVGAAIRKLMRRRSVIDIVERFQTKHAQQEGERTTSLSVMMQIGTATGTGGMHISSTIGSLFLTTASGSDWIPDSILGITCRIMQATTIR